MIDQAPSLAQLRAVVQKGRHREIGNWMARGIARPAAVYGTWAAIRLGLSAHQVTLGFLLANLLAAALIGSGRRDGFAAGVLLLHLGYWLDHVDGQVARWRGTASLDGVYFDYMAHHASNLALGFGLGFGLAVRLHDNLWCLAGFGIAAGWCLLSLHNDCRYKAYFQRLKSSTDHYLVEGGGGGRPHPPAAWPSSGLGRITWPAQKSCEPHTVLTGLSLLAVLAILVPEAWQACWKLGVAAMAILAPTLAAGRIGRSIVRGGVEAEFAQWFRHPTRSHPGHTQGECFDHASHLPLDRGPELVVSPDSIEGSETLAATESQIPMQRERGELAGQSDNLSPTRRRDASE